MTSAEGRCLTNLATQVPLKIILDLQMLKEFIELIYSKKLGIIWIIYKLQKPQQFTLIIKIL